MFYDENDNGSIFSPKLASQVQMYGSLLKEGKHCNVIYNIT